MKRPLNSDELGEKGEQRFKELCADARLTCNPSSRDRAGWDFTIDFDFDESGSTSLDHRKSPMSCRIQQKTVWDSASSVSLSLKMAARLAQEHGPAFISVLKVGGELQFTKFYLIHLSGERLAIILKRLRKEGPSASSKDLKNKKISFVLTDDEKIECSGEALRKALLAHIGADIHSYVERKRQELKTLGYEGNAISGSFRIDADKHQAFLDMFLGFAEEVEVRDVEISETRFGITHQKSFIDQAKVSIKKKPIDDCMVCFYDDLEDPILFDCKAFKAPGNLDKRIRFKHNLFSILIDLSGRDAPISFQFSLKDKESTAKEWLSYWRAMKMIKNRKGSVEVKLAGLPKTLQIDLSGLKENAYPWRVDGFLDAFETLSKIEAKGGIRSTAKFKLDDIVSADEEIDFLYRILNKEIESMDKRLSSEPEELPVPKGDMVCATSCCIGGSVMAFYLRATPSFFRDDHGAKMRLENLVLKRMAVVESVEAFEQFVDDAKKRESTNDVMVAGHFSQPSALPNGG